MAAEAAVLWKQGWHLSAEGIAALKQENNISTIDDIVKKALDEDLRSIGEKFLPEDISRGGSSELIGPCVLQVTKVRNVSAPKANEESGHAPRMLKVQMTDGHTTCIGMEVAQVQQLSLSTPPGTKVKLTGSIPISNGFLMLEGSNVKVLGGQVEKLFSRWDIQRRLAHHSRANVKVEGGAPPFVPFGQRVSSGAVATKDIRYKKSLPKKEATTEEADEFSEQRKAVIAEVSKAKEGTKTFGGTGSLPANAAVSEKKWGGAQDRRGEGRPQGVYRELSNDSSQVEEKSIQKLLEMGFSRQDSVAGLRQSSGDVEEAINTLVNRQGQGSTYSGQGYGRQGPGHRGQRDDRQGGGRGRGRKFRGRGGDDEEEDAGTRPSGPATLFDFILESKIDNLKIDDSKPGTQPSQPPRFNKPPGGRDHGQNHYDGQGWPQVGDAQFYGHRNQNEYRGQQRSQPGGRQYEQPHRDGGGRQYEPHRDGGQHFNDSRQPHREGGQHFNQPHRDAGQQFNQPHRDGGQQFNNSRSYDNSRGGRGARGRGARHERGGGGRGRGSGGSDGNYNRGHQEDTRPGRKGDGRHDHRQNFDDRRQNVDDFGRQRDDVRSNGPHNRQDSYRDIRRGGGDQSRPGNRDGREQRGGKPESQEYRAQNDSYRDHRRQDSSRQQDGNVRRQNENFKENQRDNYHRGDRNDQRQQHDQGGRNDGRRTNRYGNYDDRGGGQRQGGKPEYGERTNQPRNTGDNSQRKWRKNDRCLARYWEDGKFYPAMVTDVAPNGRTAVVLFTEYDNYEEVEVFNLRPQHGGGWTDSPDPLPPNMTPSTDHKYEPYQGDINTTLEFHRSSDRRRPPGDRGQSAPAHGRGPKEPREPRKPPRPALPIYQPPAMKKQTPE